MERVRVALISTGTWGNIRAQASTEHPRAALTAVCDLSEEQGAEVASPSGVSQVYTAYRKMLKDAEIDAVAIVTPDFAHPEVIEEPARRAKQWSRNRWPLRAKAWRASRRQ